MPQSVFDVGDLITSRLTLGVTPDGTTAATFTVYRPDGTVINGLNASAWTGQDKTVQFYATDDGTAGGTTAAAIGDWLVVWKVTGTGASVSAKVYTVAALPVYSADRPSWAPSLMEVADFVPVLTIDMTAPGSQTYLRTFTGNTSPTDDQAQRVIDRMTDVVTAAIGGLTLPAAAYDSAKTVVALRSAASLARSYARDDTGQALAASLEAMALTAYAAFLTEIGATGSDTPAIAQPVGYYPEPVVWGDWNL